jgi:hypothetical protein
MNRDTTAPGDQGDAENPEERPEAYVPRKGSLLTTLTDIVSECIQSQGSTTVERQQGSLTPEQELTNYLSEPVIPMRSEDGKANALDILCYWYRHKEEWPALTRLALSFLSCPPSSVTSKRVGTLCRRNVVCIFQATLDVWRSLSSTTISFKKHRLWQCVLVFTILLFCYFCTFVVSVLNSVF